MNKVFGTGFSRKDLFIPPSPSPQHGNRVYTGEVEGGGDFSFQFTFLDELQKLPFPPWEEEGEGSSGDLLTRTQGC